MGTDAVLRLGIEAARRCVAGLPWAQALVDELRSLMAADAVALLEWRSLELRFPAITVSRAEETPCRLDTPAATFEAVALSHPTLKLVSDSQAPAAHRLSDYEDMAAFWQSEPYLRLHAPIGSRYPAAVRIMASDRLVVFAGLTRSATDFTLDEIATLEALTEPLGSALRYREALAEATASGHEEPRPGNLTRREIEVVALVGLGWTDLHIARRLGLTERTVRKHLTSARAKIGAANRAGAAVWWARQDQPAPRI